MRFVFEPLKLYEALVCADEPNMHLVPKVGCAWRPKGTQVEVMTPGQNEKHFLVGALDLTTGTLHYALRPRKTSALFRDLLTVLDARYPADQYTRLFLPTYGPRATPIELAFGDGHDGCIRNHQWKRLPDLVADMEDHLRLNGPWKYQLSDRYYEPAVTTAVQNIAAEEHAKVAS
jgi:putative transposase